MSETVRLTNSEIRNQVSREKNEFKMDLKLHITETIEPVISDQLFPTIWETLGEISNSTRLIVDLTSCEQHCSPEMHCRKKYWDKTLKLDKTGSIGNRHVIENSFEAHCSEEGYDTYYYSGRIRAKIFFEEKT